MMCMSSVCQGPVGVCIGRGGEVFFFLNCIFYSVWVCALGVNIPGMFCGTGEYC